MTSARTLLLMVGWIAFAGLSYKVATSEIVQNAVYNPFEILGISEVSPLRCGSSSYPLLALNLNC